MINIPSGSTLSVKEKFLDDFSLPLIPDDTPTVSLLDEQKDVAFATFATPDMIPGTWVSDITVPKLDNKDSLEFSIVWLFNSEGTRYKSSENVIIDPSVQERESEIVTLTGDLNFTINIPILIDASSPTVTCEFYDENTRLFSLPHTDSRVQIQPNKYTTNLTLPLIALEGPYASLPIEGTLSPRTFLVRYTPNGKLVPETYTYKVWIVTPSVLSMASLLENFVNKSRISNVIPELRYAASDLLMSLKLGLDMFNSIGPTLTLFTGMNMQGGFADCLLICSAIQLLNMQYMAEGSLAFEFSGQSVNLSIDRTQYIDSMLGRLDAMVENQVKPFKKLLGKAGITTGDGSAGNKSLQGSFGLTKLSLAPTTRFYSYRSNFRRY